MGKEEEEEEKGRRRRRSPLVAVPSPLSAWGGIRRERDSCMREEGETERRREMRKAREVSGVGGCRVWDGFAPLMAETNG